METALGRAAAGDIFLCQNETSLQRETANLAKKLGLRVAYAAAPFEPTAVEAMLDVCDLLVLNAVEAEQLRAATGLAPQALPVRDVIVTKGGEGVSWIDTASGISRDFPAVPVTAVDTTGAGDTFTGYVLAALDQGMEMDEGIELAVRAAALKVTRAGTADAIPALDEVRGWVP